MWEEFLEGMIVELTQDVSCWLCCALRILGREHFHLVDDHIDGGLLNVVLVHVLADREAALNTDFLALVKIGVAGLGKLVPGDNVEPIGIISTLSLFLCVFRDTLTHGEGEFGNGCSVLGVAHFGVFSKITNKNDLVHVGSVLSLVYDTHTQFVVVVYITEKKTARSNPLFSLFLEEACGILLLF